MPHLKLYVRILITALLFMLAACSTERTPGLQRALEFDICRDALELPAPKRAFQGYDGWFFFNHEFKEDYKMLTPEQAGFVTELNRAFATQGVRLIAVPVPGRAAIRPGVLYPGDPKQRAFSPAAARAYYANYLKILQRNGVAAVDVMAVAGAFDAAGGQTFFKRDLHWTPEGAQAVAQETAKIIYRAVESPLPTTPLKLTRNPYDKEHQGRFINNWLRVSCGYDLPPEPLGDYTVSRLQKGQGRLPEVVQAGSSFGGSPFDVGFLSVALQSEVLNVSVGNGGALFALESYLATDTYQKNRPQVLVWEYPAFWRSLTKTAQRRLLAGAYGVCSGDAVRFEHRSTVANRVIRPATSVPNTEQHYLTLSFEDLSLLHFGVTLRYQDGFKETLKLHQPEQVAKRNQGRYFVTLSATATSLKEIGLELPDTATGKVTVQVCHNP